MPTTTTTYRLSKPTVGGDADVWGTELNNNADKLDDVLDGTLPITPAAGNDIDIVGTNAATNTVTTLLTLNSQSSGTPAAGIGSALAFAAETAAGNTEVGVVLEAVTTDVTAASEDFDLVIKTMAAGATAAERVRVRSTGQLVVNGAEWTGAVDPENRIINGAMDFWQRGASFSTTGYGAADRWRQSFVGGTVTQSRQSFTVGDTLGSNSPTFFLRQAVSEQTLSDQFAITQQLIESVRSYAGQTITVLGWARRSSGSGNMALELVQNFGTGGTPSGDVTGTGQLVTLTGSFAPFAVTFAVPSITGKTIGTDGNDRLVLNFWTSAGSTFNTRAASIGVQTIGVDLWGIHIKLGTHTTAAVDLYKAPDRAIELTRCQRYYERGDYHFTMGVNNSDIVLSYATWVSFSTRKRSAPTVTGTNDQGTFSAGSYINGIAVGRSNAVANRVNSGTYQADAEL